MGKPKISKVDHRKRKRPAVSRSSESAAPKNPKLCDPVYSAVEFKVDLKEPESTFIAIEKFTKQGWSDLKALKSTGESEPLNYDLVLEYCSTSPECEEFLKLLDTKGRKDSEYFLIYSALEVILLRTAEPGSKVDATISALTKSIFSHLSIIYSSLALRKRATHVKMAMRLLTALVLQGHSHAGDLELLFEFNHGNVKSLLKRRDVKDNCDVRSTYIRFIVAILMNSSDATIIHLAERKGCLNEVLQGVYHDTFESIKLLLTTIQNKIVLNPQISKTIKCRLFNEKTMCQVSSLYSWKGPSAWRHAVAGKAADPEGETERATSEEKAAVRSLVHTLLMSLCTDVKVGLTFFDRQLGIPGKNHNPILTRLLQTVGIPASGDLQQELVVGILKACPDQLVRYFTPVIGSFTPRNHDNWIQAIDLLVKIYTSLNGMPPSFMKKDSQSLNDLITMAMIWSSPSNAVMELLNLGIKSGEAVVLTKCLSVVKLVLQRAADIVKYWKAAEFQTNHGAHSLEQLTTTFQESLLRSLPSYRMLTTRWQMLFKDDPQEDGETQTTSSDDPEDVPSQSETALAFLEVFDLYVTVIPSVTLEPSTFSSIKILEVCARNKNRNRGKLMVQALQLLNHTDTSCLNILCEKSKSGHSGLGILLSACQTSRGDTTDDTAETLCQQVAKLINQSGLFVSMEYELVTWLSSLILKRDHAGNGDSGEGQDKSATVAFFELCLLTLLSNPYPYFDELQTWLMKNCEAVSSAQLPFSPMVLVISQKWKGIPQDGSGSGATIIERLLGTALLKIISQQSNCLPLCKFVCDVMAELSHPVVKICQTLINGKYKAGQVSSVMSECGEEDEAVVLVEFSCCLHQAAQMVLSKKPNALSNAAKSALKEVKTPSASNQLSCYVKTLLNHRLLQLWMNSQLSGSLLEPITSLILTVLNLDELGSCVAGDASCATALQEFCQRLIDLNPQSVAPEQSSAILAVLNATLSLFDSTELLGNMDVLEMVKFVIAIPIDMNQETILHACIQMALGMIPISHTEMESLAKLIYNRLFVNDGSISSSASAVALKLLERCPFVFSSLDKDKLLLWMSTICHVSSQSFSAWFVKYPQVAKTVAHFFKGNPDLLTINKDGIIEICKALLVYINKEDLKSEFSEFTEAVKDSYLEPVLDKMLSHGDSAQPDDDMNGLFSEEVELIKVLCRDFLDDAAEQTQSLQNMWMHFQKSSFGDNRLVLKDQLFVEHTESLMEVLRTSESFDVVLWDLCLASAKGGSRHQVLLAGLLSLHSVVSPDLLNSVSKALLKEEDTLYAEENLDSVRSHDFRPLIKRLLKKQFENPLLMSVLAGLVSVIHGRPDDVYELMTSQDLFTMVTSHSMFIGCLMDDKSSKGPICKIISTLITNNSELCQEEFLPIFQCAYGGTLHPTDMLLLSILQRYDAAGHIGEKQRPLVFGSKAVPYVLKPATPLRSLHQTPVEDVIQLFDVDKLRQTTLNFPLRRDATAAFPPSWDHPRLQDWIVPGSHRKDADPPDRDIVMADGDLHGNSQFLYDPGFVVTLLADCLRSDREISLEQFIQHGCLSFLFACLGSHVAQIRAMAYYCLVQFSDSLALLALKRLRLIGYLVDLVKHSLSKEAQKVPCLITMFLVKCTDVLQDPGCAMYTTLVKFLLSRPALDLHQVPDFLKLFNSTSTQFKTERLWILDLLRKGLRETGDYHLCERKEIITYLLSFYDSSLASEDVRAAIFEVLHQAASVKTIAIQLVRSHDLFGWIVAAVSRRQGDSLKWLRLLKLTWDSLLEGRTNPLTHLVIIQTKLTLLTLLDTFQNSDSFFTKAFNFLTLVRDEERKVCKDAKDKKVIVQLGVPMSRFKVLFLNCNSSDEFLQKVLMFEYE